MQKFLGFISVVFVIVRTLDLGSTGGTPGRWGYKKLFNNFCGVSNSKSLPQVCCLDRNDHPEHHHLSFSFYTSSLEVSGSIQRDRFTFEICAASKRLSVFCATALGSSVPKHGARLGLPIAVFRITLGVFLILLVASSNSHTRKRAAESKAKPKPKAKPTAVASVIDQDIAFTAEPKPEPTVEPKSKPKPASEPKSSQSQPLDQPLSENRTKTNR